MLREKKCMQKFHCDIKSYKYRKYAWEVEEIKQFYILKSNFRKCFTNSWKLLCDVNFLSGKTRKYFDFFK